MSDDVIVGEKPGTMDQYWLDAAKALTPAESMNRLDTHGKYLFTVVAVVGTLLTGFGILTPGLRSPTPFLLIPVSLASLSLALAMMGITPRSSRVRLNNITAIADHFNKQIRLRGRFVTLAGVTFALSLVSVALVVIFAIPARHLTSSKSVRFVTDGKKATVAIVAEFPELSRSSIVDAMLLGLGKDTSKHEGTILFHQLASPDTTGGFRISAEIGDVAVYQRFVLRTEVRTGSDTIFRDSALVNR